MFNREITIVIDPENLHRVRLVACELRYAPMIG